MIKLLVVILNKDKNLKTILKKYKLSFNIITYARGTASKSILSYFGLDEVKKDNYKAGNTLKLILPFFAVENLKYLVL